MQNLVIHGGTISSGSLSTLSVDGVLQQRIISVWKTTLPGVVATFCRVQKALVSVILTSHAAAFRRVAAAGLLRP